MDNKHRSLRSWDASKNLILFKLSPFWVCSYRNEPVRASCPSNCFEAKVRYKIKTSVVRLPAPLSCRSSCHLVWLVMRWSWVYLPLAQPLLFALLVTCRKDKPVGTLYFPSSCEFTGFEMVSVWVLMRNVVFRRMDRRDPVWNQTNAAHFTPCVKTGSVFLSHGPTLGSMCIFQVLAWIDVFFRGKSSSRQCNLIYFNLIFFFFLVSFSSGMYFLLCICRSRSNAVKFAQNVCLSLLSTVTGLSTIALH